MRIYILPKPQSKPFLISNLPSTHIIPRSTYLYHPYLSPPLMSFPPHSPLNAIISSVSVLQITVERTESLVEGSLYVVTPPPPHLLILLLCF